MLETIFAVGRKSVVWSGIRNMPYYRGHHSHRPASDNPSDNPSDVTKVRD